MNKRWARCPTDHISLRRAGLSEKQIKELETGGHLAYPAAGSLALSDGLLVVIEDDGEITPASPADLRIFVEEWQGARKVAQ